MTPAAPEVLVELRGPLVGLAAEYAPGDSIPLHRHPCGQLVFASSGVMTVTTPLGIWVVPPERAVWVPPDAEHAIRMTGRVSIRTLYLAPAVAAGLHRACGVLSVSGLLRESILRAMSFDPPCPEDGPEARVIAVILDEIAVAPVAPLDLPMPRDARARRVAEALRAEPGDPRRLDAWAGMAGTSPRTLERLFERETGRGFVAWRRQARLLRSLESLAAGASVTETALLVGYETPSAFISAFRRALGTTPGRYFGRSGSDDVGRGTGETPVRPPPEG